MKNEINLVEYLDKQVKILVDCGRTIYGFGFDIDDERDYVDEDILVIRTKDDEYIGVLGSEIVSIDVVE